MSAGISIDTSKLDELIKQIPGNRNAVVKATAFHVLGAAQKRAPVDTGYLHDHADVTGEGSSYDVNFNAEYAAYVELGTYKMAAHPFLTPAVEAERQLFIERLKKDVVK